jgi:two-component system cell cycle sensor histidine kinase/response regulator CckA
MALPRSIRHPIRSSRRQHLLFAVIASLGVWASARLICERRERQHSERHQAAQLAVTRILAESVTLAQATPQLFKAICQCEGWDWGGMWEIDQHAQVLRCEHLWHSSALNVPEFERMSRTISFPRGVGLPGRVWASGQPAWIPDVVKDGNFTRAAAAQKDGLHGAFGFPVRLRNEVLAVMEFVSRVVRPLDQELLSMMAEIGVKIGHFIDRRRAEERLRKAETDLVDSKVAAMFQVAAGVAHELRNPLGIIRNSAYYLKTKMHGDPKVIRHLQIIDDEIAASDRVIDELVHFGRPIQLDLRPYDVHTVIKESLSVLKVPPEITVTLNLAERPMPVLLDKDHFRRVLINLFSNALQAMDSDGELRIATEIEADNIHIIITDTGKGIALHDVPRIFEPFFTTKAKGIGLGLPISKQIIELHHGRIGVRSEPLCGTTFSLSLPFEGNGRR